MGLLDIRQGKLIHLFKGFAGGIRSLQCHETKPVVASCGLDRFLRVHDIESKALLYKVYMKSRLNCVVMSQRWGMDEDKRTGNRVANGEGVDEGRVSDNEETDALWDNMEIVKTRTVKKSEDADTVGTVQQKRKSSYSENDDMLTKAKVNCKKSRKKKNKQKDTN